MAAAGRENGYIGITPDAHNWKAQIRHHGNRFWLPATGRPEDAARWYDRAMYKLRGQSEGLNFPLSDEARAELDAMSLAEFLAEIQVEKAKAKWARHTSGASRFYGVSFHTSTNTWRVRAERRSLSGFSSDEIAADMVDNILLEVHGPSAMTNAKYHSGEEVREQAWQELKEMYRQVIEAGIDESGKKGKASQGEQKEPADIPARASTRRANPQARTKRKHSVLEQEGGVPLASASAPACRRRVRRRMPAASLAGPKGGYRGVTPRSDKWQSAIRYQGRLLHLPTVERPDDAARWLDRATYKLHGQSEGLNFPLSDQAKAELDAMSVAEFLAEVQVEKDKAKWANFTTGKSSRFYGVSSYNSGKTWKVYAAGRRLSGSNCEKRAADVADSILLEVHGPSAMTNAKYHSGEEGREKAWQELKEKYRQDFEAGIDASGPEANANKRGHQGAAMTIPSKASQRRATPKGRTKRKDSSSDEEEEDMPTRSDDEHHLQSPLEDASSEDLELFELGSNGGSLYSEDDMADEGIPDDSQEEDFHEQAARAAGGRSPSTYCGSRGHSKSPVQELSQHENDGRSWGTSEDSSGISNSQVQALSQDAALLLLLPGRAALNTPTRKVLDALVNDSATPAEARPQPLSLKAIILRGHKALATAKEVKREE